MLIAILGRGLVFCQQLRLTSKVPIFILGSHFYENYHKAAKKALLISVYSILNALDDARRVRDSLDLVVVMIMMMMMMKISKNF